MGCPITAFDACQDGIRNRFNVEQPLNPKRSNLSRMHARRYPKQDLAEPARSLARIAGVAGARQLDLRPLRSLKST